MKHGTCAVGAVLALMLVGQVVRAGTLEELDRELTALAERVSKSVVTVASELKVTLKDEAAPSPWQWIVPIAPAGKTNASGVIYDKAGHVITVASAVPPGRKVTVTLPDGETAAAKVVGRDSASNLAVLKVEAEGLVPATWGTSGDLKPGSLVVAVGSSFGMGPSVTLGVISATGRSVGGHADLIQITAPINPGDSGGMLANSKGELVGIITATFGRTPSEEWLRDLLDKMRPWQGDWPPMLPKPEWFEGLKPGKSDKGRREEFERWLKRGLEDLGELPERLRSLPRSDVEIHALRNGKWEVYGYGLPESVSPCVHVGSQGMNYALPADTVKVVVDQLIRHGKVSRGWLGVGIEARSDSKPGVVVAEVAADSPAAKASLKPGDRILAVGERQVNSFAQLARTIARRPPGSKVELRLRRGDQTLTLTALLTERPETPAETPREDVEVEVVPRMRPGTRLLGIQYQPLTEDLARHFGVKDGRGVLVAAVEAGSPAEKAGIKVADCIVAVEKEPIKEGEDLRALLRRHAGKTVTLEVIRDHQPISIKVALPAASR